MNGIYQQRDTGGTEEELNREMRPLKSLDLFFSPFFTKERKSNILFIETAKIYFPFVVFVQHANIVCRLGYFFVIKKTRRKQ